jgi:hypothetical protein
VAPFGDQEAKNGNSRNAMPADGALVIPSMMISQMISTNVIMVAGLTMMTNSLMKRSAKIQFQIPTNTPKSPQNGLLHFCYTLKRAIFRPYGRQKPRKE